MFEHFVIRDPHTCQFPDIPFSESKSLNAMQVFSREMAEFQKQEKERKSREKREKEGGEKGQDKENLRNTGIRSQCLSKAF